MLEKLFGVGSFGGSICHPTHCQAILAFLGKLGFPFVIWTIAFAFLGCWALIIFTFIIHFKQDDHLIILDAITHVETKFFVPNGITKYPSPVTLCCSLSCSSF
jgi:hypothetical protein